MSNSEMYLFGSFSFSLLSRQFWLLGPNFVNWTFGHVTLAPGIANFRELGTFGHVTLAPVTANFRELGIFGSWYSQFS